MNITKAIIPVAGKGTRFLPASKGMAKEMFPVVNIPVLMIILEECMYSGIKEVCLVVSKEKEYLKSFFVKDKKLEENLAKSNKLHYLERLNTLIENMKITVLTQGKHIGSAGSFYVAKKWANNQPFAVLFGDDLNYTPDKKTPVIGQLMKAYEKHPGLIIGCKEIDKKEIYKYSACVIEKQINKSLYKINGIVEKPKPGTEPSLISGLARYIVPANTFEYIENQFKTTPLDKEIGLTDLMNLMCHDIPSYALIMDSIRYDTGDVLGYVEAIVEYGLRDKEIGKDFKAYLKNLKF